MDGKRIDGVVVDEVDAWADTPATPLDDIQAMLDHMDEIAEQATRPPTFVVSQERYDRAKEALTAGREREAWDIILAGCWMM